MPQADRAKSQEGGKRPDESIADPTRLRRRRATAASLIAALIVATWTGCTVTEENYAFLSRFFDGVPSPGELAAQGGRRTRGIGDRAVAILSSHSAFVERRCDECHGSAASFGLAARGFSDLDDSICLKCHEGVPREFASMHGPIAGGECLSCHDPHESPWPTLLVSDSPALCTHCHEFGLLEPTPAAHLDPERSCLDCHHAHGGDDPYFLRPLDAPIPEDLPDPAPAPETGPGDTSDGAGGAGDGQ